MSSRELTYSIIQTAVSSDVVSPPSYMTRWYQKLQATDSKGTFLLRDRLSICQLALFQLPEEALSDIKEEMEYKIRYYRELAEYDAEQREPTEMPRMRARVNKPTTRPPFYLPIYDD